MSRSSSLCVLFSALAATSAVQAAPPVPEFLSVEELTGHPGLITAVSSDGRVFSGNTSEEGKTLPFRYSVKDGYRVLVLPADLPADTEGVWMAGMSDEGSAVYGHLQYDEQDGTYMEGFVWTVKGGFQRVGQVEGGKYTVMRSITKNNKVLGGQYMVDGQAACFVWTPRDGIRRCEDVFPDFPAAINPLWISNNQKVIWAENYQNGFKTMRWVRDKGTVTFEDLPGGNNSLEASAMTGDGRFAVGNGHSETGYEAVFFESDGTLRRVFPARTFQSYSMGMTPGGRLVYGAIDPNLSQSMFSTGDSFFLDRKTGSVVKLSDILADHAPEAAAWTGVGVQCVSDNGDVIVGYGVNPAGKYSSWVLRGAAKLLMPKPQPAGH
jgi:hypothetical protein